jgi:hypothetical protein
VSTGEESRYVGTAAKPVEIAPQQSSLLVTERYGFFENLKRQHLLYAAQDGKLKLIWSAVEGAGPTWSAVRVIPARHPGAQDIAYFDGFLYPSNDQPDRIDVTRLHWDGRDTLEVRIAGYGRIAVRAQCRSVR